jgi:O2-independent ubiquinone biosynthesis protein UbiU
MELVCPAGNLSSLKAAVDNGANAVYMEFKDDTSAHHFAVLDFDDKRAQDGIRYAHDRGVKVFVAINSFAQPSCWSRWQQSVDHTAGLGVDALILADIGLMDYASHRWPDLRLHLSVQGAATNAEAINFYLQNFAIQRIVLPRDLPLKQLKQLAGSSPVAVEVIGFGSLYVMLEEHCLLSSYVTGRASNTHGVCALDDVVNYDEKPDELAARLNDIFIDKPAGLNTLELLPELQAVSVAAIKIEGRERSPAYVEQVTRVWRQAIDLCEKNPEEYKAWPEWIEALEKVSQASRSEQDENNRPWQ